MVVSIAAQPRSARFSRMSEVEWLRFRNIYFICESALMRVGVMFTRESAIGFIGSVRTAHRRVVCFAAFGQADSAKWRTDSESNCIFFAVGPNEDDEEGEGDVARLRCCRTAAFFWVWPFLPSPPPLPASPRPFRKNVGCGRGVPERIFRRRPSERR